MAGTGYILGPRGDNPLEIPALSGPDQLPAATQQGNSLADIAHLLGVMFHNQLISELSQKLRDNSNYGNLKGELDEVNAKPVYTSSDIADAVAGWNDHDIWGDSFSGYARRAGQFTFALADHALWRLDLAPDFYVVSMAIEYDEAGGLGFDLRDVDPSEQHADETDLVFLQRVRPDITWQANFLGTRFAGAFMETTEFGVFEFYYAPLPLNYSDLVKFFRYTPSSGPPDRSVKDDIALVMSLLPVQWGS